MLRAIYLFQMQSHGDTQNPNELIKYNSENKRPKIWDSCSREGEKSTF